MKAQPVPLCPNQDAHTPRPEGYVSWFEWSQAMSEAGWQQQPCDGCKAFVVWVHPDPEAAPVP